MSVRCAFAGAGFAILLGACAPAQVRVQESGPPPPTTASPTAAPATAGYNLAGYPPAFRDGFTAACESLRSRPAGARDEARYRDDPQYAMGWRDGREMCARK